MRKLVAYFSASGTTKKVAEHLAKAAGVELFEIRPIIPYSSADLNWMDKKSRSSVEMNDPDSRPEIAGTMPNMADYDTVFIGFPIWWYTAPHIIHTFLERCDFSGKTLAPFATSGGSDFGNTAAELQPSAPGAEITETAVLTGILTDAKIKSLAESCK